MTDNNGADKQRRRRATKVGVVASDKMDKSVTVAVERKVRHPLFGKYIRRTSKHMAHDENNDCRTGDKVTITSCRPMSKRKVWRVVEVLERASR